MTQFQAFHSFNLLFKSLFNKQMQQRQEHSLDIPSVLQIEIAGKTVRVFVFPESSTTSSDMGGGNGNAPGKPPASFLRYSFQVGSVETFERQLEAAQTAFGWPPEEFVPVVYR